MPWRLRLLGCACILLAGCAPRGQLPGAASIGEEQPNVLLILIDDFRPEMGAYGVGRVVTPNMDRLAEQGLLFERAYTQQAVCAPSRATLLSGLRPDSTGIHDLNTPLRSVMPQHVTLPQHFRQHGYTTLSLGKIYHHGNDDLQGWSEPPMHPAAGVGRGYLSAEAIRAVEAHEAAHRDGSGRGPSYEAPEVHDTAYADGKVANRAIAQLRRLRDRPFFMAVGFYKPHLPFNAPRKYWDLYPEDEIRLPENYFTPRGVTRFSLANFGELRNYTDIPRQGPVPDEKARALIRGYLAATSYVDAQVGRVLDELERLGLDDNTVVVLWGDHGFKLGEHAEWVKHTNFEIDTRVPLVVRTPGMVTAGRRTDALVETVDLYPTLSDLAGLPAPAAHQGYSFAPLLREPARPWKSAAFSQYPRGQGVMGRSIRTDRYHYIEWQRRETGEALARELYDHRSDPQENVNVAGEERYAAAVSALSGQMAAGWRAALPAAR